MDNLTILEKSLICHIIVSKEQLLNAQSTTLIKLMEGKVIGLREALTLLRQQKDKG